jgi:hypothetical protein
MSTQPSEEVTDPDDTAVEPGEYADPDEFPEGVDD